MLSAAAAKLNDKDRQEKRNIFRNEKNKQKTAATQLRLTDLVERACYLHVATSLFGDDSDPTFARVVRIFQVAVNNEGEALLKLASRGCAGSSDLDHLRLRALPDFHVQVTTVKAVENYANQESCQALVDSNASAVCDKMSRSQMEKDKSDLRCKRTQ